jgi:Tol biopolymer transport system component
MRGKSRPLFLAAMVLLAVLTAVVGPAHATFGGANGRIAFSSNASGNREIYSINPDGTGLTNLTNNSARDVRPAWSPDGSRIAFDSNRDGDREIYVMNADGTGQQRVTTNPAGDSGPSWSPNGARILFDSNRDGDGDLYTVDPAIGESSVTQVANIPDEDFAARYAPEGGSIVFSHFDGTSSSVYRMRADGTKIQQLTPNSLEALEPDWSPDGNKIVFENNTCDVCPASDILVMNANGKHVRQLTQSFGNNLHPRWSPDGTKITFQNTLDFSTFIQDIYTMNVDGSGRVNVTASPSADDTAPDWGSQ